MNASLSSAPTPSSLFPRRRPRTPLRALALLLTLVAGSAAGCVTLTPYDELRADLPAAHFVRIDGHQVHVVDRGPRAGEPVVFVHGFGASSYSWRHVTADLPGYRTIALDLRGFGYTERPTGIAPYTREGQVELLRDVLDRLALDRVHLVGHSYGGAIALTFATVHPERLLSLVAIDSARPDYPQIRRRQIARLRPLTELYIRSWALRRRTVQNALESSIWDDSLVTRELVDAYLDRLRVEGAPRAYFGVTAPAPEPETEVQLAGIETPVLVVWGAEDRLIPVAEGRKATEKIPCHRFVVFPETGHMPMEERPETLAAALRDFFRAPGAVCDAD